MMADDIRLRGLLTPIVLLGGRILDGRCRHAACILAGVEPAFTEYAGTDPLADVLSWNIHRRHMSESQRAMVAASLANMKPGRPHGNPAQMQGSESKPEPPAHTREAISVPEAAAQLNVSERLVRSARALRRESPELTSRVELGHTTIGAARRELDAARAAPDASRAVGIRLANDAIACLLKIPLGDPLRKAGMDSVIRWIEYNR